MNLFTVQAVSVCSRSKSGPGDKDHEIEVLWSNVNRNLSDMNLGPSTILNPVIEGLVEIYVNLGNNQVDVSSFQLLKRHGINSGTTGFHRYTIRG